MFIGIYKGKDVRGCPSVIHFKGPANASPVKGSRSLRCTFNCGYEPPENGGTVESCIDCFSKCKMMYKMQYMLSFRLLSRKDGDLKDLEPGKVIAGYRNKMYISKYYLGQ